MRYVFNKNFFAKGLTSHKHAYICGLFLSDGNCYFDSQGKGRIIWQLKYSDHYILREVCKTLESTHKIVFNYSPKRTLNARLEICSHEFAKTLNDLSRCKLGCKSRDIGMLPHLENEFISSLILGIIDDGSWVFNIARKYPTINLAITSGSFSFLQWIHNVVIENVLGWKESDKTFNDVTFHIV